MSSGHLKDSKRVTQELELAGGRPRPPRDPQQETKVRVFDLPTGCEMTLEPPVPPLPIDLAGDPSDSVSLGIGTESFPTVELPRAPARGTLVAGRYRVAHYIGEGGMGRVYEVTHVRLGSSFALKVLRPELVSDREVRDAFFREARLAASVKHPGMAQVLDFGVDPSYGVYMLMELVTGVTLSSFASSHSNSQLSVARAVDLVFQVAETLEHIHRKNILHCDIKPQNIVLELEEVGPRRRYIPRLVDFGLAQNQLGTGGGSLFGTPHYVPPEVLSSRQPTAQSDVYSLGVLLFELIAGTVPFRGKLAEVLEGHRAKEPPRLADFIGDRADPGLEALIGKVLAKNPEDRPPDMAAFLFELRTLMRELGLRERSRRHTTSEGERREAVVKSTFQNCRLPLATIAEGGEIVAANSVFARFVYGMNFHVEGHFIQDTPLAAAWETLEEDLQKAFERSSVGRRVEIELGGAQPVRLQMWLEPINLRGFVALSLFPEGN